MDARDCPSPAPLCTRQEALFGASVGLVASCSARSLSRHEARGEPWPHGSRAAVEARLTVAVADRRVPGVQKKEGPSAPPEDSPWRCWRGSSRGDSRSLAAAYLVRGDRRLADQALERSPPRGDAPQLSRRIAPRRLFLKGLPESSAPECRSRARRMSPGLAQAHWNRALAHECARPSFAAARSFSEVARQNEPGWNRRPIARGSAPGAGAASPAAVKAGPEQAARELITTGRWPSSLPALPQGAAQPPPPVR